MVELFKLVNFAKYAIKTRKISQNKNGKCKNFSGGLLAPQTPTYLGAQQAPEPPEDFSDFFIISSWEPWVSSWSLYKPQTGILLFTKIAFCDF